ncbi:hypothetical protein [Pseudalkalibacillus sp. SCS-8]|uniref:hypothetical protein n=1 Tax=Pseudalkalibacillus nanhaiensis TaxID=3115291 RepID=UPI0032DA0192
MAQLIKIEDCVSRYEKDVYRYTGQYIRLKSERWKRLKASWEKEKDTKQDQVDTPQEDDAPVRKWWPLNRKKEKMEPVSSQEDNSGTQIQPLTLTALKRNFRRELFKFQLKWASTTIREKSMISKELQSDPFLRFLMLELPDNYLILYKPIIKMKKAEAQLDVILIGPDTVQAIAKLDSKEGEVIHPALDRFWEVENDTKRRKIVSPVAAIKRMNHFIESVVGEETDMSVSYTILGSDAYVNRSNIPPFVQVIDRTNFKQWLEKMKKHPSPIKHNQLKIAKRMLEHCATTAYLRPEWEPGDNSGHFSI